MRDWEIRKYRLFCRDLGIDDDFVSYGKTKADVVTKMLRYIMRVYGISFEDLGGYRIKQMMNPVCSRKFYKNSLLDFWMEVD